MGKYLGHLFVNRLLNRIKSEFLMNGSGITVSTDSKGVSDIGAVGNDISVTCRPADESTGGDGNINIYGNVDVSDCPAVKESTVNVVSADTLSVGVIDKLAKVIKSWMKFSQNQLTMSAETIERNANKIEERCKWFQVFQKSEGNLNEKVFKVTPEGIVAVTNSFKAGGNSSRAAISSKSVSGGEEIKLRGSATNNITVGPELNKIVGDTLFKDGDMIVENQHGSLCISPRLQKSFDISGMVPAVGERYVLSAVELDTFKMTPEAIVNLVEQGSVRLSDGNVSAYATITLNGSEGILQLIFSMNFDMKSAVEMRLEYLDGSETPAEGIVLHRLNYDIASNKNKGLMSATDKQKLDKIKIEDVITKVDTDGTTTVTFYGTDGSDFSVNVKTFENIDETDNYWGSFIDVSTDLVSININKIEIKKIFDIDHCYSMVSIKIYSSAMDSAYYIANEGDNHVAEFPALSANGERDGFSTMAVIPLPKNYNGMHSLEIRRY